MKKSLLKIAILLLAVIAVDRLGGWYMSRLYERNYCMHSGGELNHYLHYGNSDILFLGSSRVNTMIDPSVFSPKATNVSQPAKHILYHIAVADLLDQYKKMPSKMLVMNVEVEDIYMKNQPRLVDDVFYLKYYYNKNAFVRKIIQGKDVYERFKFLSSLYRFNGENFRLLTNPLQNICVRPERGYMPLQKTPNDSIRLEKGIADMKKLQLKEISPAFFQNLKHLQHLCQKNKVKLVLLYAPNYYYPESFRKASLYLQHFCQKQGITYLDFSLQQDKVFNQRSLWFDHIHLNAEGSKIYTRMLKKKLG